MSISSPPTLETTSYRVPTPATRLPTTNGRHMEVDALPLKPGIVILTCADIMRVRDADERCLGAALDEMGKRSARAQGLKRPITTWGALRGSDHKLVLSIGPPTDQGKPPTIRGLLRIGERSLFVRKEADAPYSQISPVCVLDFYVHESCQRTGDGKRMFEAMLAHERLQAHQLGYDRPSSKLLAFCGRHYGLKDYVPQNNNFVVFSKYWSGAPAPASGVGRRAAGGRGVARSSVLRLRQEVARAQQEPAPAEPDASLPVPSLLPSNPPPRVVAQPPPPPPSVSAPPPPSNLPPAVPALAPPSPPRQLSHQQPHQQPQLQPQPHHQQPHHRHPHHQHALTEPLPQPQQPLPHPHHTQRDSVGALLDFQRRGGADAGRGAHGVASDSLSRTSHAATSVTEAQAKLMAARSRTQHLLEAHTAAAKGGRIPQPLSLLEPSRVNQDGVLPTPGAGDLYRAHVDSSREAYRREQQQRLHRRPF